MSGIATAAIGSAVIGGVIAKKGQKAAEKSSQAAIDASAYQGEIATDQYDFYKKKYQPLESELVDDAQKFDTPAAYDLAASEAQSTVSTQLGLAKDRLTRTPGLDPSSPAAQAANATLELKGAAMGVTAQNQARTLVKDKAYARKVDAVGLGKGLVANATSGLASSAATAQRIASSQADAATAAASGAGALFSGVVGGLSKIKWGSDTPKL